jgi:NADPH:quinone reductase-like Zn-dependent oxidoreductase
MTIETDAWVLYQADSNESRPGVLRLEKYSFPDIDEREVLAEPIYGCWEANMTHAIERDPVDVVRARGEERIVLGNAGVVRVLRTGSAVTSVSEGDVCALCPVGRWNEDGYLLKVLGYDAPGTIGLLAKRIKLHEKQLVLLPLNTRYPYQRWAGTPVRYATAWANWKVTYECWRLQHAATMTPEATHVWGWGGGVTLAELLLAKLVGCQVAMLASKDERLAQIAELGIQPIDRRKFADLDYDGQRFASDRAYKKRHVESQRVFADTVKTQTGGAKVSIFIDNIGAPVISATLRALSHRGVVTTVGWKKGMHIPLARANECIQHHIHVHTHGCPLHEAAPAMWYAEEHGWLPPVDDKVYGWDEIPQLAEDYASEKLNTYFPIFQVNPL